MKNISTLIAFMCIVGCIFIIATCTASKSEASSDSVDIVYTSRTGDVIKKRAAGTVIVWVEDERGTIKAVSCY